MAGARNGCCWTPQSGPRAIGIPAPPAGAIATTPQDREAQALAARGDHWLISAQNTDGGWGGALGCPSSIEETALAANQAVGDLFRKRGLPTLYRVHPEKDPDEIAAVAANLAKHGIRVPQKERLTGRDIGRLIRAARRKPNAEALLGRIMGLVERSVYEVKDHEDVAKHWGLA